MSTSLILALAAGYLAGNPQARREVLTLIEQATGKGIDALNSMGGVTPQGETNVTPPQE